MFKTLKTAALSALIGLGTLAAVPATTAQAEGLYLNFGDGGDARFGVYVGEDNARWHRRNRDQRWDRNNRWDDDNRWERRHHRRGCSAERALDKAERIGLRRARIVDVDRRTITVKGRKWGDRVTVTFARAPNCPIVRW